MPGTYPQIPFNYLKEKGWAPAIEAGDMELLAKGKPDFIGVNYYQTITYERNPLDGVSEENEHDWSERDKPGYRYTGAV